jgi:hypothetical protein
LTGDLAVRLLGSCYAPGGEPLMRGADACIAVAIDLKQRPGCTTIIYIALPREEEQPMRSERCGPI